MKKILFIILILFLLTGCEEYSFTCYDTREPSVVKVIEVEAIDELDAVSIARQECQDKLSKIILQRK